MPDPWPWPPGEDPTSGHALHWPVGITKTEVWNGCPAFYGEMWGEDDVAAAERACVGWKAILRDRGAVMFLVPPEDPDRPFTFR